MTKHKKHNIGQDHPRSKFSDNGVRELKNRHFKKGEKIADLAKKEGTTYNYMYKLVNYYYKHLE